MFGPSGRGGGCHPGGCVGGCIMLSQLSSYFLTIISWLSLFSTIREAALDTRLIPSVAGLDQAVL